jgi:23S rRNA pseudouridine2605 synthase
MADTPRRRVGLARALSKLGVCSRSEAFSKIRAGGVRLNGSVIRDPEFPVDLGRDQIDTAEGTARAVGRVYLMLNKPRGLLTTTHDEKGRSTVFECLVPEFQAQAASDGRGPLPRLVAVGRLDKASEGMLLFSNDTAWADAITAPSTHIDKTYHVQIGSVPDESLLLRIREGAVHDGERLTAKRAQFLRAGDRHGWVEIVLDEGRNRHIRRLLAALGVDVLRLVRVAMGPLLLGPLPKGHWRHLLPHEIAALGAHRPHTRHA